MAVRKTTKRALRTTPSTMAPSPTRLARMERDIKKLKKMAIDLEEDWVGTYLGPAAVKKARAKTTTRR